MTTAWYLCVVLLSGGSDPCVVVARDLTAAQCAADLIGWTRRAVAWQHRSGLARTPFGMCEDGRPEVFFNMVDLSWDAFVPPDLLPLKPAARQLVCAEARCAPDGVPLGESP